MRLDYGMPTLLELETIETNAALAGELGLKFIEINMNMPQYQIDRLDVDALQRASAGGLYFTFHLDENFNPSDFNRSVAGAYLNTAISTIRLARAVGAPVVNLHMAEGIAFKLPDRKVHLFEKYREQYLKGLVEFREACRQEAGNGETKICVENTGGFLPFMQEGLETLLQCDCFKLTLDIGHSHSAGGVDEAFIRSHVDRLAHMHIHDAGGERCHLVLGSGEIDLEDRLKLAAGQGCRCVIETKSTLGLRASVAWLKDRRYL
jgi:sugar phosphate isomerase/epimerase